MPANAKMPADHAQGRVTIAGAASDNSQVSQSADARMRCRARTSKRRQVGVEARAGCRRSTAARRGRTAWSRVGQEGHRRGDRRCCREAACNQRSADDLQPGHHQENADEQADRHAARHRAAGESPQVRLRRCACRTAAASGCSALPRGDGTCRRHERRGCIGRRSATLPHQPRLLALPVAFLHRLALVVHFLAPGERKLDLRPAPRVEIYG